MDEKLVIASIRSMNKLLPPEYLKRNRVEYEYVSYISLVCTSLLSSHFEATGTFVKRAYAYLDAETKATIVPEYLNESVKFLRLVKGHLIQENLISEDLKRRLLDE